MYLISTVLQLRGRRNARLRGRVDPGHGRTVEGERDGLRGAAKDLRTRSEDGRELQPAHDIALL